MDHYFAIILSELVNEVQTNKIGVNVVGPYHLLYSCILSYPLDINYINELELTSYN